jgi:surface antigen
VHVFPAPAPAAVVYPPWIVVQQGPRAYHPQYQPRPVSSASRCNSQTAGRVLGGVVGGVLGNQIGQGNGRTVATIGGAVAGVLIGGEIGRRMDAHDQGCVGQVLEVAPVDRPVQWVEGPAHYVVVPGQVVTRQGSYCRPYTVELKMDGYRERSRGVACRRPDGTWVAA